MIEIATIDWFFFVFSSSIEPFITSWSFSKPWVSISKRALSVNFSSIAIELNVPRDDFSSIAI